MIWDWFNPGILRTTTLWNHPSQQTRRVCWFRHSARIRLIHLRGWVTLPAGMLDRQFLHCICVFCISAYFKSEQVGGPTCDLSIITTIFKALAQELAERHATADLSDIHLLVKVINCQKFLCWHSSDLFPQRKLAMTRLGEEGVRQGAEERSSLLSKLLFSRQKNSDFLAGSNFWFFFSRHHYSELFSAASNFWAFLAGRNLHIWLRKLLAPRYEGRCKGSVSEKGNKMKSPFATFLSLSLPGSRSSSPAPQPRHSSHKQPTIL